MTIAICALVLGFYVWLPSFVIGVVAMTLGLWLSFRLLFNLRLF